MTILGIILFSQPPKGADLKITLKSQQIKSASSDLYSFGNYSKVTIVSNTPEAFKMKQVLSSELLITNLNQEDANDEGRVFDYALNQKRAKNKLLKGAKRTNSLEVESKQGCVTLRFCNGSFFEIIMPLIRAWQQKRGATFKINEIEVEIIEVVKGTENSEKHVDTKLIIMANCNRIVIHVYNGTQKVMVQGNNYEKFALVCLEPFFRQQIQIHKEKIRKSWS